jgi:hypothetical protein
MRELEVDVQASEETVHGVECSGKRNTKDEVGGGFTPPFIN